MNKQKKIVAILGSIREGSSNTNILKTIATLILDGISIPELKNFLISTIDRLNPSNVVKAFRITIGESSALIICTPEYAAGISGVL